MAPVKRNQVPQCLADNVKALLSSKASDRVIVETADWGGLGITDNDYLYSSETGEMWLDPNHPNPAGARKITAQVARWIAKILF
jgi:lysophospholipase L1-like esterase